MTWAKLSAIQANCGIEMTLDACMLRLSEVVAAKKKVRLGLDGPKKKPPLRRIVSGTSLRLSQHPLQRHHYSTVSLPGTWHDRLRCLMICWHVSSPCAGSNGGALEAS